MNASIRVAALLAAAFSLVFASLPAAGADILGARYEPARDDIVAEIAYRGTSPDHDFTIQWGRCQAGEDGAPAQVAGRLIDAQGRDVAREDYRILERIALDGIPCRPAMITLRLGLDAHAEVFVPRTE
jgi:hypothetical protein